MIKISPNILLSESELEFSFIRSPGPGGQNVNKVATAVQLRFDLKNNHSLPAELRARLMKIAANRINQEQELIVKAVRYRSQERNKQDALKRLIELIKLANTPIKKRRVTKPSFKSIEERLSKKKHRSEIKAFRRKLPE